MLPSEGSRVTWRGHTAVRWGPDNSSRCQRQNVLDRGEGESARFLHVRIPSRTWGQAASVEVTAPWTKGICEVGPTAVGRAPTSPGREPSRAFGVGPICRWWTSGSRATTRSPSPSPAC